MKLLLISIFLIALFISSNSYSFNRWFHVSPGLRIAASVVDLSSRVPKNQTNLKFSFGFGANLDFRLEKFIGLDIDLLYVHKGSYIDEPGNNISLDYISLPILFKLWLSRKEWAFSLGIIHSFLISAQGKLANPNVLVSTDSFSTYDLALAFGLSYIFLEFSNGIRLVGDFRFEIGLVNLYRGFRPEVFNRTYPYFSIGINF